MTSTAPRCSRPSPAPLSKAATRRSKSYAERLFEFIPVGPLDREDARKALCLPAEQKGVSFEESAILEVLEATGGYSYFIQEWGKHAWNESKNSPITREDARHVGQVAIAELATSFFRVRFDRLPPSEKKIHEGHGGIGTRTPSLRGYRGGSGKTHFRRGSHSGPAYPKRDDL